MGSPQPQPLLPSPCSLTLGREELAVAQHHQGARVRQRRLAQHWVRAGQARQAEQPVASHPKRGSQGEVQGAVGGGAQPALLCALLLVWSGRVGAE